MSMKSSVAVMAGLATDQVLSALRLWSAGRARGADFARPAGEGAASYASVVSGQVNYLDVDELKAVIRDAARVGGAASYWEPVGVMVHEIDAGGQPKFFLLSDDGTWS